MADNSRDFEIRLKASGGDKAAKEVQKVSEAVEDLGATESKAAGEGKLLEDRFSETRKKLEELREATKKAEGAPDETGGGIASLFPTFGKAAKGAKSFGGTLLELAGGPLGIVAGGITTLSALLLKQGQEWKQIQTEAQDAAHSVAEADRSQTVAAASAAAAASHVGELADRYGDLVEKIDSDLGVAEGAIDYAQRRAVAEVELAKAILRRRVAEKDISQSEADYQMASLDKGAIDAKNRAAIESAAAEKEAALKVIEAAKERQKAAEAELEAAAAMESAFSGPAANAQGRASDAKYLLDLFTQDGLSADNIIAGAGGLEGFNQLLKDALGGDFEQSVGEGGAKAILADLPLAGATGIRKKIVEHLTSQAEAADKVAKIYQEKADEENEDFADLKKERGKELDAAKKAAEAATKRAIKAEAALESAIEQAQLDEQFTKPTIDNNQAASTTNAFNQAQIDAANSAAKAAEEGAKQEVDQRALGIAGEIQNKVAGAQAPNTAAGQELLDKLSEIATALSDGTDQRELIQVTGELGEAARLAGQLGAEAKQAVNRIQQQVDELRSIVETNRGY